VDPSAPHLSIVIPIHNEASVLQGALGDLTEQLFQLNVSYEVLLAENGSSDGTLALAQRLAKSRSEIRVLSTKRPNYGLSLRSGIEAAKGRYVVCDEIDLLDASFYREALAILESGRAELVVGSKLSRGASDERPWWRHVASLSYTRLLRLLVGFRGTDTHGLKAFRREPLLKVVRACRIDKDVFASELVIRAERAGLQVIEIPTRVRERRPPSIHLYRRIPSVCRNLAKLTWSIRVRGDQ